MRSIGFVIGFLVSMSLALSSEAAELFTPSYPPYDTKAMPWDFAKKVEVVRVNGSALFPEGVYFKASAAEELTFQIEGITYEVFLHKAENHANGSRTWFGKVSSSPFLSHFVAEDGRVVGEIWLPMHTPGGIHWSLVARDGLQFLVQFDEDAVGENLADKEIVPALSEKELEKLKNLVSERRRPIRHPNPCGPGEILTEQIDLMYLYDDTSLTWWGFKPETAEAELRVLLQNSADDINATIWNSKAEGYRVNLVAREKVKYVAAGASGGWMSEDWQWMANSPEVAALRNTYKADVVGLWVGVTASSLGLAGGGYLSDLGEKAYHVIMVGGGVIVATHEFGHNLSMGHQPSDWSNPKLPYALAHFVNLHFRTAVSIYSKSDCPNFCDVVPVFSNPAVLVAGLPAGVPDERENWRNVAPAFSVVSQYRDGSKAVCLAKGGTQRVNE